jgi:PAS domain S-box-containing protein
MFSILALITSLGVIFLAIYLAQDVFINPQNYFNGNLSASQLQLAIISVSGIIVSISISMVVFLLLTYRARTDLAVWKSTRWLAISREQFRRLYDSAPVPYIMLNSEGEIHEPNKAALRFFEVTQEEIEGKDLFSFCSEQDSGNAEKLFRQYKLDVPINREEMILISKSGKEKWVLLSIFEMKNPASKTHTGLATQLDITDLKKLDQAKTEFLSIASHQLRTPLVTVKWYTDMLMSGDLGDLSLKQRDYIERLFAVNEDMVGLVDMLLNVSRIEIGTLPIDLKPTNVQEITDGIFDEFAPQITKRNLNIDKKYNNSLKNIKSDPKLLRIVIQNLISNAIKYTPDNGKITVILEESFGTKRITVSDTGFGIPKNQQDQVFTKLFRAENAKKMSAMQGSGLGLYLAKSIVESLGGSINFSSEENKGSNFIINI